MVTAAIQTDEYYPRKSNELFGEELAGAIQTVYPRVLHQRCWVHKMRNIREKARARSRRA